MRSPKIVWLTREEIASLLNHCPSHLIPIVRLALSTGMRRGEILSLTWNQVDLARRMIVLEDTKNNERREVPLNQEMVSILANLPRHLHSPVVFFQKNGVPYKDVKTAFKNAVRRAGIMNFRFHDLRHTAASCLVMSGASLKTVQEILGHKSLIMTMKYAHLSPDYKRDAVERLSYEMDTYMDTKEHQRAR